MKIRRGICFNATGILAIKEGRKVETRRPCKVPPAYVFKGIEGGKFAFVHRDVGNVLLLPPPYGKAGRVVPVLEEVVRGVQGVLVYVADGKISKLKWPASRFRPRLLATFMPDIAVRFYWKLLPTTVERVQDITQEGARREGFDSVEAFRDEWDRIYAGTEFTWGDNPLVFVVGDDQE